MHAYTHAREVGGGVTLRCFEGLDLGAEGAIQVARLLQLHLFVCLCAWAG